MALRKLSQRQRIVAELAAIRKLQAEPPSFFVRQDFERLRQEWVAKSAALVELELTAYQKRLGKRQVSHSGFRTWH